MPSQCRGATLQRPRHTPGAAGAQGPGGGLISTHAHASQGRQACRLTRVGRPCRLTRVGRTCQACRLTRVGRTWSRASNSSSEVAPNATCHNAHKFSVRYTPPIAYPNPRPTVTINVRAARRNFFDFSVTTRTACWSPYPTMQCV